MIKTNSRFDKLTNLDIATHYRDKEFYFMRSDFLGAFACWVIRQSPYDAPDITDSMKAFEKYILAYFQKDIPMSFTYDSLHEFINEKVFENIPEIEKLNHAEIEIKGFIASSSRYHETKPEYDYIDLCALARNIVYMLMREYITTSG